MLLDRDELQAYDRDGVTHLKNVIPFGWIEHLRNATEDTITDHSPGWHSVLKNNTVDMAEFSPAGASPGSYFVTLNCWREHEAFMAFASDSPAPAIAGDLMMSDRVYLYEDAVHIKEPGTQAEVYWHNDRGYHHVEGPSCVLWIPLDPITEENGGLVFMRGTHKDPIKYRPNLLVDPTLLPGTEGEPIPVMDDNSSKAITFDMVPGDALAFSMKTFHMSGGNQSPTTRRRALAIKYLGKGARWQIRPGVPLRDLPEWIQSGMKVKSDDHSPLVWWGG